MISVLVAGAAGRVGSFVVRALEEHPDFHVAGTCGRGDDLAPGLAESQVLVDFTCPEAGFGNAIAAVEAGVHPVIGTSGITESQQRTLQKRCKDKRLGGLLAANFALGAVLLQRLSKQASEFFPDFEIIESHHPGKRDAPSGTAIDTVRRIKGASPRASTPEDPSRGWNLDGVSIHSVRLPGLIAEQEVRFGGPGQTLSLTHRIYERAAFVPGVLLACSRVLELDHLVVGLDALLFGAADPA